jgi:hypothetical protein
MPGRHVVARAPIRPVGKEVGEITDEGVSGYFESVSRRLTPPAGMKRRSQQTWHIFTSSQNTYCALR